MQNDTIALLIMKIQLFLSSAESYTLNVQISNTNTATLKSMQNGGRFLTEMGEKNMVVMSPY